MNFIKEYFEILYSLEWLKGILMTLELTCLSLLIGAFIGIIMSFGITSSKKYLSIPINAFIFIIKGTPILVQIFMTYYGIGCIGKLDNFFIFSLFKTPFFCAIFALAINSAAYMSSLIEGAINSIPKGQYLSAQVLGMPKYQTYKSIIIPQIIKKMLPAYSNEAVILLKSTSLVTCITLMDIMGVANRIIATTYNIAPTMLIVSIIYIILNISLSKFIETLGK